MILSLLNCELFLSKDKNNKDIYTNLSWEIERDWISFFCKKKKKIKFFNATKEGLKINNVIDMSLSEIEKKYLKKQFDFKSYIHFLSQKNKIINAQKKDFQLMRHSLKESFQRCKTYLEDNY